MCIAVPMRVLEVRSDSDVVVTRPGRTEIANASFADEMPAVGDLVLVFRGTILRKTRRSKSSRHCAAWKKPCARTKPKAPTPPLPTSLKTPGSFRRTCKSSSVRKRYSLLSEKGR